MRARWRVPLFALLAIFSLNIYLVYLPRVFGDTFGTTSTSGMSTWSSPSGYVWFARYTAPTSGQLASITLTVTGSSPSASGNVGIYADSSATPGTLLAHGSPQTLTNGANVFSSLSASVSIVATTNYWLAFVMTGASFYYGGTTGLRGWGPATCCNMPTTVSITTASQTGGYGIFGTYTTGPDFSITATPTSQNVAAGSTASFTLNLASSGGYTGTVNLSVTSGCPSGVTCSVTPTSVSSYPASATLSVPTLITTTGSYNVVVTASDGTITHTVTVAVSVTAPNSYSFNVRPGATQIVITVSWTGTGTAAVTIAGPGGSPTISESAGVIYDRTSIIVTGGTSTSSNIHRVTFTISPPGSSQSWTLLLSISGTTTYNVTIEVS